MIWDDSKSQPGASRLSGVVAVRSRVVEIHGGSFIHDTFLPVLSTLYIPETPSTSISEMITNLEILFAP